MQKITIFALHLDFGGIEKYISNLCRMFSEDYEIEIITTYKLNDKPAFEIDKKVKIKYLIEEKLPNESIKKIIKKGNIYKAIKIFFNRRKENKLAYKLNIKEAKKLKTDYVITTREFHNKIINKHVPSNIIKIATEHNYHNNDKKYIAKLINSVSNFDYLIHCTKELFDFYKPIIKGPKHVFIPNTIELNQIKANLNNKNIISVGRLSIEKGFEDLIDVMEIVNKLDPKIKLTICGDGYLREKIENKISQKKLKDIIKITGFIRGKELEEAYINSSLYVLPSISECFGLVLLEAMNYNLPCIAFDTASGARELLKNDIGILIKDRNKNDMAKSIVELLNNKKLLEKYSNLSLHKVEEYDINRIKKIWYKEVLYKKC